MNASVLKLPLAMLACGLFTATAAAQPANDECSAAIVITAPTTVGGDNTGATGTDLSSCAGTGDINDIWYSLTTSAAGIYSFNTNGSPFDTTLSVFASCEGPQLGCDDDGGDGLQSLLSLNLANGQTVLIRIAGYNGAAGPITLNVSAPITPSGNDDCSGAVVLMPGATVTGTNVGASGTDITSCAFNDTIDVWYSFTPGVSGTHAFDTLGPVGFDTTLALFSECPPVTQLACDDDAAGNLRSRIQASLTQGTTYYVRVAGYNGNTGSFTLNSAQPSSPAANDLCTAAAAVTLPYNYAFDISGSTEDLDVSCNDGGAASTVNGVWFSYTPPADQLVRFAETSAANVVIALFTGDCTSPVEVFCSDAEDFVRPLTGGTPYRILLGAFSAAGVPLGSSVNFSMTEVQAPTNDTCSTGIVVAALPFSHTVDISTATNDVDVACNDGANVETRNGVWYRFTPANNGLFTFNETSGNDVVFGLFSGSCDGLSEFFCTSIEPTPPQSLNAGTPIFILVGLNSATAVPTAPITFTINEVQAPTNDACADAINISSTPFSSTVDITTATSDLDISCNAVDNVETRYGVWYTFTPPVNGLITLNETSSTDVAFAVHSGTCATGLTEVHCTGTEPTVPLRVDAGVTYTILVGLNSATVVPTQPITFTLNYIPAPGACCVGATCSVVADSAACTAAGGAWQGPGSSCGDPQATNANATGVPDYDGSGASNPIQLDISIPDAITVADVDITVDMVHTFGSDFHVRLQGPNGVIVTLFNRPGVATCTLGATGTGGTLDGAYVFDDQAAQTLHAAYLAGPSPIAAGRYRPAGCANAASSINTAFAGISAAGTWSLLVSDEDEIVTGTVRSFAITINGGINQPCTSSQGACCANASCTVSASTECTGPGRRFAGAATVCNTGGNVNTPCCKADTNQDGTVAIQDLFDFLILWFAQAPGADVDGVAGVALQDLFDFLRGWFGRCQ